MIGKIITEKSSLDKAYLAPSPAIQNEEKKHIDPDINIDKWQCDTKYQFPVPSFRFDQKDEVDKRSLWDEELKSWLGESHSLFQDIVGYRQLDFALRTASYNVEHDAGHGNICSNTGLYSWTRISKKKESDPYITQGKMINHGPSANSQLVKQAALALGASLVGICEVHPSLVYSHEFNRLSREHYPLELPHGHTHAVVLALEMDYGLMQFSPNAISAATTGMGYSRMAFVASLVATFIRGLGYNAAPCGNDTALSIPLAMAAGLGEIGRNGLLITKKFGPRVRLCKVFTDMPLMSDEYRPFGVYEMCRVCKKCAEKCPSHSISHDEPTHEGLTVSNHNGPLKWYINPETCLKFFVRNRSDCTNCINTCPFNKTSGLIHDASRAFIRYLPIFNRFFVWLDNLLGYGRPKHRKEFWSSL